MTTADVETTKRRPAAARTESSTFSSELVEAGTSVADRGVRVVRTAVDTGIKVSDAIVLGSLGVAEEWATSTPFAGFAIPPVKAARETWGTTRDGLRELVAAV